LGRDLEQTFGDKGPGRSNRPLLWVEGVVSSRRESHYRIAFATACDNPILEHAEDETRIYRMSILT
jgi:hypothetical protein